MNQKTVRAPKVAVIEADIEDRDYTVAMVAKLLNKTAMRINQICNQFKLGQIEDPYGNGAITRIMSRSDVIAIMRHINKVGRNYQRRSEDS